MSDAGDETPLPPVWSIGRVSSPITRREEAPRQGDEGAPTAWLDIHPRWRPALADIRVGDRLVVLTWLHEADRDTLAVHPRGDPGRPLTGVFATRSPDRPNPIGVHDVTVVAVEIGRLEVSGLEAIDGTPILDLKPQLGPPAAR